MTVFPLELNDDDLHHRSFLVTAERRELLWQEMDACLALADRLSASRCSGSP